MGTVNYKTSDYITLGLKPYEREDFVSDECFKEDFEEFKEMNPFYRIESIEEYADMLCNDYTQDDLCNVENILEEYKRSLYFYSIKIEFGYYVGFSINIENNFGVAYDSWEDKRDAQKEITLIKKILVSLIDNGLCVCFPSWGTTYLGREDGLKEIDKAIKAMRDEAKHTPTWLWYERDQHGRRF